MKSVDATWKLPSETHTYSLHCASQHTHQLSRDSGVSQTPTLLFWDPLDSEDELDYILLVLWEIPFIKLCSLKKLSTFTEVHFNK